MNKKIGIGILIFLSFALIVFAAESNVFVHTNFHLKNLYNATNISIVGTFTDGVLSIANGTVTGIRTLTGYYNTTQTDSQIVAANSSIKSYADTRDQVVNSSATEWNNTQHWPVGCPANTYLTNLSSSVTCAGISDLYLLNTGDTGIGNYNFTGNFTAGLYFGNGSQLTGMFTGNTTDQIFAVVNNNTFLKTETTWVSNSSTVARIGNCTNGNVVMNITNTGVQCVADKFNTTDQIFAVANNGTFLKTYTNLTEDNVEAYIFDNDNTDNFNMSTYNISQNTNAYHCFGPSCATYLYYNGTTLIIKVS